MLMLRQSRCSIGDQRLHRYLLLISSLQTFALRPLMADFLDDLLKEAPEEGSLPVPASGAEGENGTVERVTPHTNAPVPFSPEPAATLARRIVGTPRKGRKALKRLTQRHKLIIGLHLAGKSNAEVSDVVGCSRMMVSSVIRDPLAQEVITYYYEGVEDELKALFPAVVDTVRDALDPLKSIDTRLKGVDRFAKLTGLDAKDGDKKDITMNVIVNARTKFVQEIRAAREKAPVVEVEATLVEGSEDV